MKKVFLICAHQLTKSLAWSVEYLSSFEENIIIIHYDKKSDIDKVSYLIKKNVYFVDKRIDVTWGAVSQIYATIELLKYSLKFDYEYCFFISGDDVPTMNNVDMNSFLLKNNGANFIHYQDERNKYIDPYERCIYRYPEIFFSRKNNFLAKLIKKSHKVVRGIFFKNKDFIKRIDEGIIPKLYKGTNWFTLTYESVQWLVQTLDKQPAYLKSFEYSLCADEVFFHSIFKTKPVFNIYHDISKVNDVLRYIDWTTGPQYPRLLNVEDINAIKTKECFFCRKVDDRINESEFIKFKQLVISL
ncbi:core-2/I-branching enzyme [Rouxiella silvae]|uniref:Peptide O-xylosyltransferase n=1 Tax=Rouxiella silvae TaxID=1646373 RepID=A0AA40X0C2_9GAMM|nr:beta-1,6-N-acetylglucosaminyltransferase [Rouxiella silvae]MBF6636235.1 core-2/I-branching enzyme [Rouxiella silvae]